eukprot:10458248-Ditylum_brightwellii.AAC.1
MAMAYSRRGRRKHRVRDGRWRNKARFFSLHVFASNIVFFARLDVRLLRANRSMPSYAQTSNRIHILVINEVSDPFSAKQ